MSVCISRSTVFLPCWVEVGPRTHTALVECICVGGGRRRRRGGHSDANITTCGILFLTSRIVSKLVDVEAMIPWLEAAHLTSDSGRPISLQHTHNSKLTCIRQQLEGDIPFAQSELSPSPSLPGHTLPPSYQPYQPAAVIACEQWTELHMQSLTGQTFIKKGREIHREHMPPSFVHA